MKKNLLTLLIGCAALSSAAAPSILDIKRSITDNNIIAPESFETKTRELEENFYLRNFVVQDNMPRAEKLGTDKEYEQRLATLPTEIEMPYNSIVGKFINMYLGKRRGLVADMLALHSYYGNIFVEELLKENMPVELQYLPVIESAINPNAVSRAGAAGLWQFMPGTAKGLGMEVNSLVDERRDPRLSSRNAARYLKQLYNIYDDWSLAIAAYNCGPGNVNKALRRAGGGKKDFWEIYQYLPAETRSYVPAFIAANYVMNFYNKHNINPTVVKRHLTTDTIYVKNRVHFKQIAEVLNIPIEEIRMLNPQFRKDIIPGNNHPYALTLPKQQVLSYMMSEDAILAHDAELYAQRTNVEPGDRSTKAENDSISLPTQPTTANATQNVEIAQSVVTERIVKKNHKVTRGENIRDIAKLYGVSATDIKRWNHLRRGKVKEGDELVIEVYERVAPEKVSTRQASNQVASNDVPRPRKTVKNNETSVPNPPARQETAKTEVPSTKSYAKSSSSSREIANNSPARRDTKKDRTTTRNSKKKQTTYTKPRKHEVKSGESLERIARANGISVEDLKKANPALKNPDKIKPGQEINLPKKSSKTSKGKTNSKSSKNTKKSKSRRR